MQQAKRPPAKLFERVIRKQPVGPYPVFFRWTVVIGMVFSIFQFAFMAPVSYFPSKPNWKPEFIGHIFAILHAVFLVVVLVVLSFSLHMLCTQRRNKCCFLTLLITFPFNNVIVCAFYVWESTIVQYSNVSFVKRTEATLRSSAIAVFGIVTHVLYFCFCTYAWERLFDKYRKVFVWGAVAQTKPMAAHIKRSPKAAPLKRSSKAAPPKRSPKAAPQSQKASFQRPEISVRVPRAQSQPPSIPKPEEQSEKSRSVMEESKNIMDEGDESVDLWRKRKELLLQEQADRQ